MIANGAVSSQTWSCGQWAVECSSWYLLIEKCRQPSLPTNFPEAVSDSVWVCCGQIHKKIAGNIRLRRVQKFQKMKKYSRAIVNHPLKIMKVENCWFRSHFFQAKLSSDFRKWWQPANLQIVTVTYKYTNMSVRPLLWLWWGVMRQEAARGNEA